MSTLVPGSVGVVSTAVPVPAAVTMPSAEPVTSAVSVHGHGGVWCKMMAVVVLEKARLGLMNKFHGMNQANGS